MVQCSTAVVILPPVKLSNDKYRANVNTGNLIYKVNDFTTNDANCGIISYKADTTSIINQSDCTKSGNLSDSCKQVTVMTSNIGTFYTILNISAKGGTVFNQ